MESVAIYFQGNGLMIFKQVAKQFNIQNGYRIKTEAEFWEILGANASYGLAAITPMCGNSN